MRRPAALPHQTRAQRSGSGLERRSSGMSALWLLQKSRSKRYKACSDVAEMKRFELLRRLPDLPHFECGPFDHLGTSPNIFTSASLLKRKGEKILWFLERKTGENFVNLRTEKCRKPAWTLGFPNRRLTGPTRLSSQPRYDRFDTAPSIKLLIL